MVALGRLEARQGRSARLVYLYTARVVPCSVRTSSPRGANGEVVVGGACAGRKVLGFGVLLKVGGCTWYGSGVPAPHSQHL